MGAVRTLNLISSGTLAFLCTAGCAATQDTGLLAIPTWDFISSENAQTSDSTFDLGDFVPAHDTLYAIPLTSRVKAGEPVRILVITGEPARPFSYMAGVSVTAPRISGFDYVPRSFNVGALGGDKWAMDGFWSALPDKEILAYPDNFIRPTDMGSLRHIDFNVTPLGQFEDLWQDNASGALFNFEATFSAPGVYRLGFVENDLTDVTYYSDHNLYSQFWGDITNQHEGVPNTITVTDADGNVPLVPTVPGIQSPPPLPTIH